MQAEYIREWTETYLCVFPEKPGIEPYIEQMLQHQPGIGRLEFSKELQSGREGYRYKVSGKKALSAVYAALPMKEGQIRQLLQQVIAALEDAKECLLAEEDFLLEPSHMFLELPQLTLKLCYVPGYGKELEKQLEGLLEYMLNRVDYEDKPAVELLYDCYTICMKYRGGLEPLKKRLEKQGNSLPANPLPVAVTEPKAPTKATSAVLPPPAFSAASALAVTSASPTYAETAGKQEQQTYASWIKGKLGGIWRRKKEAAIGEEGTHQEDAKAQEMAWEAERRQLYEQEDCRTVLLAVGNQKKQPKLLHEQTGEIILLTAFPFYLGSGKEYATHTVLGNGISRLHFCIQKREEKYYLSDLNSTNGTYVNGQEVFPGTEKGLTERDVIRAASEEFLFSVGE